MSNDALRVLRKVWIPGPAKAVAIVLADHADDRRWSCWVSQQTLGFETGLSRRTVQRALQVLKDEGLIAVTERYGSKYGRDSNVTRLIETAWRERATGRKELWGASLARLRRSERIAPAMSASRWAPVSQATASQ